MGRLIHKKVFSLKSFVIPVLLFSHLVALSVKKKKKKKHKCTVWGERKATWKLKALGLRDFFKLTLFLSSLSIYVLIWLCWVLVVACELLVVACRIWFFPTRD